MNRAQLVYAAYMVFFTLLVGLVFITPLLAFEQDMELAYGAFSYTCHQKLSRSLCLFNDGGYAISDCAPQQGNYITDPSDKTSIRVEKDGVVGYKLPVCSRDIALYAAMLLGGLLYPLARELDDKGVYPAIFLVIAIIPIGIDGGLQFISDIGLLPFVYESTNLIRLITGGIAGLAAAFYAIPILVNIASKD